MLFHSTSANVVNACYVGVNPGQSQIAVVGDSGSGSSIATLPSSTVGAAVQNGFCAVMLGPGTATGFTRGSTTLTLTLEMYFAPTFAGAKSIYLSASATGVSATGWQARGTWTAPSLPVSADSVSPQSGVNITRTFTLTYGHTSGASNITQVYALFNTNSATVANSCYVGWDRNQNRIALVNDSGSGATSALVTESGTLQNAMIIQLGGATAVVPSGTTVTLTLALTFKDGVRGLKTVYMSAAAGTQTTGWQTRRYMDGAECRHFSERRLAQRGNGRRVGLRRDLHQPGGSATWRRCSPGPHHHRQRRQRRYIGYRRDDTIALMNDAGTSGTVVARTERGPAAELAVHGAAGRRDNRDRGRKHADGAPGAVLQRRVRGREDAVSVGGQRQDATAWVASGAWTVPAPAPRISRVERRPARRARGSSRCAARSSAPRARCGSTAWPPRGRVGRPRRLPPSFPPAPPPGR